MSLRTIKNIRSLLNHLLILFELRADEDNSHHAQKNLKELKSMEQKFKTAVKENGYKHTDIIPESEHELSEIANHVGNIHPLQSQTRI